MTVSRTDLSDFLRAREKEAREFVANLDADAVLSTPVEDMVERVVDQFEVECPILRKEAQYSRGAEDAQIDVTGDFLRGAFGPGPHHVPGTRFELRIPFDGDRAIFALWPIAAALRPPRAKVEGQELIVTTEAPADSLDPIEMRKKLDESLAEIETPLDRARSRITTYNDALASMARERIERRRAKVLADRALEDHLAVPVVRRSDRAKTLAVEVPKKRRAVQPIPQTQGGEFKPEPAITPDVFETILRVIASFASAAERFPGTFYPMGEVVLREIVLVILNNQFGPAGGELFSRVGKTDVAILHDKGPVFIGECKIWKGQKALMRAVDQLLDYLVWRDTKAALILFVRNRNVSAMREKAGRVLESHDRFKRRGPNRADHEVFVLHHEGDVAREVDVALVTVPIPRVD